MYLFIFVFLIIMINGVLCGHKRKWFVYSSFGIMTLVAALRKYTVGIDLGRHYAFNYEQFASMDWSALANYMENSYYDPGFCVFMKLLGMISGDRQFFIIVTSIMIYGLTARYIYRHSDDVVLETFLFITSFTYFMYMNIVAQALAIAVVLFGIDYLAQKKYYRFALVVLIASLLHSSALFCLLFIPLTMLPSKRKYIVGYIFGVSIGTIFMDAIINILIKTVFPNYAYYFTSSSEDLNFSWINLFQSSIYIIAVIFAGMFLYQKKTPIESALKLSVNKTRKKGRFVSNAANTAQLIPQLQSNFLLYMALGSVSFRIIIYQNYILSRMGFYVYFFSFSLIARAVANIQDSKQRKAARVLVYAYMFLMFFVFYEWAGVKSYGVLPYEFFFN